jgi:hypothetical protein
MGGGPGYANGRYATGSVTLSLGLCQPRGADCRSGDE